MDDREAWQRLPPEVRNGYRLLAQVLLNAAQDGKLKPQTPVGGRKRGTRDS